MGKPEDADDDPNQDLFLIVDFKLMVHFTVMKLLKTKEPNSTEKFSRFLQERGSIYSKYKDLAQYFAIPYITDNPEHFLLLDIQKVTPLKLIFKLLIILSLSIKYSTERMDRKLKDAMEDALGEKVDGNSRRR